MMEKQYNGQGSEIPEKVSDIPTPLLNIRKKKEVKVIKKSFKGKKVANNEKNEETKDGE